MKHKKAWILAANLAAKWVYYSNHVLQLGQILSDDTDHNSAILRAGVVSVPKDLGETDRRKVNFESFGANQTAFRAWLNATLNVTAPFATSSEMQKTYQAKLEGQTMSEITFHPAKSDVEMVLSQNDASDLTSTTPLVYDT